MKMVSSKLKCPLCHTQYVVKYKKPGPHQDTPFELKCEPCGSEFQFWAKKRWGFVGHVEFSALVIKKGERVPSVAK